jgi:hypothetical protein
MSRLKAFRLFFTLAALLFVAKPFFGYGAFNQQSKPRISHSVLVKSFTKRKPENLEEADANAEYIHQLLINPLAELLSAISFLLLFLFPQVFRKILNITTRVLSDIHCALLPPEDPCVLVGQLII